MRDDWQRGGGLNEEDGKLREEECLLGPICTRAQTRYRDYETEKRAQSTPSEEIEGNSLKVRKRGENRTKDRRKIHSNRNYHLPEDKDRCRTRWYKEKERRSQSKADSVGCGDPGT